MKGNNLYCKKLVLKLGENVTPTVIFGIIKEEDEKGFTFLTGRGNVYKIHKESDYDIIPTNKLYIGAKK